MKKFLEDNKIYFETFAVLALGIAGLLMAGIQGCWAKRFSEAQNKLAEQANTLSSKSVELTEKELELANLQTNIAKVSVSPRFTFDMEFDKLMTVTATNSGAPVQMLSGDGVPYVTFFRDDNRRVMIALKNYFYFPHGKITDSQKLHFFSSRDLAEAVITRFRANEFPTTGQAVEKQDEWPLFVGCVYSFNYADTTGALRTTHYLCQSLDEFAAPLEERDLPKWDAEIDASKYFIDAPNGKYDAKALVAEVHQVVDRLSK